MSQMFDTTIQQLIDSGELTQEQVDKSIAEHEQELKEEDGEASSNEDEDKKSH